MLVRTWMTPDPATIGSTDTLSIAQERMQGGGFRRLPVVDDKGQLVGIVAADDLLSLAAAELSGLAVAVRTQSPSGDPSRRES